MQNAQYLSTSRFLSWFDPHTAIWRSFNRAESPFENDGRPHDAVNLC